MLNEDDIEIQLEDYWNDLYESEIDDSVKDYFNYLESSYDVNRKTLEEKRNEIYNAIKLVEKHIDYYSAYLIAECTIISNVTFEYIEDIESSIFLSIHGKYKPANALLRKWLETFIVALYYDSEIKRYKKNSKMHEKINTESKKWLNGSKRTNRFLGDEFSILATVIDADIDDIARQLLIKSHHFKDKPFNKYIEELYSSLSKNVHYGGIKLSWDNLSLDFATYKPKLFDDWFLKMNQIDEICNILILLKFPEMLNLKEIHKEKFPTLEENQLTELKKLLGPNSILK